jgi:ATP-binding cassette subfamily F protein uup
VIEAQDVAFGWPERELFHDVSLLVQSGDRVGIVGPNGAGKTTLLRVLLGELPPGEGHGGPRAHGAGGALRPGPGVARPRADGLRGGVGRGARRAGREDRGPPRLPGRPPLPRPDAADEGRGALGGERNRLLLARLFLQGANLLALDEPTNDLDLPTLNVLERLLLGFTGAVLLVTHDRYFLDKVATRIVAVEGDGTVVSWPGNFTTYRTLRSRAGATLEAPEPRRNPAAPVPASPGPGRPKRLGYQAQRELEGMEATIEAAEARRAEAEAELLRPEVYSDGRRVADAQAALASATAEVDRLYARWAELTSLGDCPAARASER